MADSQNSSAVGAQPSYPLLIIDPKGWLSLERSARRTRFSALGALNSKKWIGFDSLGTKWQVAPDSFPALNSRWKRFLTHAFFNPRFEAELRWIPSGRYSLEELQEMICTLVDRDDDLLTQFVEGDKIKTVVRACKTFSDLTRKLQSMRVVRGG